MSSIEKFATIADLFEATETRDVPLRRICVDRDVLTDVAGVLSETAYEIDEWGIISPGLLDQVKEVLRTVEDIIEREGS